MKEVEKIEAQEDIKVRLDDKGFFVIFIDDEISVEHYKNVDKGGRLEVETGDLNMIITGSDAKSICDTLIREDLISRLDHMAYVARELQKAEIALKNGLKYVQSEKLEL